MYVTLEEHKLRCELKYITNENDKAKLKQDHKECVSQFINIKLIVVHQLTHEIYYLDLFL